MFMALYRGPADKRKQSPGAFTRGRLYVARPEVDDPSVVVMNHFYVNDDSGRQIRIDSEGGLFEYPEKGYAVVVRPLPNLGPGEVVVVDDLDGGDFYSVVGFGFVRSSNLQLLDMVLLSPGVMAYDKGSYRWVRVMRVDDSIRIALDDGHWREPTEFRFAVSGGEMAMAPFARCKSKQRFRTITVGKLYQVAGVSPEGWIVVQNDKGIEEAYPPACFVLV